MPNASIRKPEETLCLSLSEKREARRNRIVERLVVTLPPDVANQRILTSAEAAAFCGFGDDWWGRLYRSGRAPKPIRLSERRLGWRVGDLIAWLDQRAAES